MFISCGNEDIDKENDSNDFTVSKTEIENLLGKYQNSSLKKTNARIKQVESVLALNHEVTKEPLIYVVNIQEGGFLLMAADKRVEPILAYSFDNNFVLDEEIDQGLAAWFETKINYIDYVKANIREPLPEVTRQWNAVSRIPEHFDNPHNNCDFINDHNYNYGSLLQTRWNQGTGFNNLMPVAPTQGVFACQSGNLPSNGRYYAGCVPVAIAQIARYHQMPAAYNWAAMDDITGGSETSFFIKYIHDNIPITYACDGTSVSTGVNKGDFFQNKLGYSSAISANWTSSIVLSNIENNRPVFVEAGSTKKTLFGIKVRGTGHAWVCDGARSYMFCEQDSYGNYYGIGSSSFYMNWGWGGSNNGYYSTGYFNTTNGSFNYEPKIVYNIIP